MSNFESAGKFIIAAGILVVILGLIITFWSKIPFLGKLPGDIFIQKGNSQFFFPVVTCLLLSVGLTLIINLIIRLIGK